jgi:peptidoglycan/xylan/chitin deacetylase (PgdA/CDA1 family)
MQKYLRRAALQVLQGTGVFRLVRNSRWRQQRLLILCYHGIAQEDEHQWRPGLYMHPKVLEQRLQLLKNGRYNVLGLGQGLQQLEAGQLPPRSVAITFDDGCYDFYAQAYPLLKRYGFPVTVYQTTYYSDYQKPIFNLICSYMLWQRRGTIVDKGSEIGFDQPMDLRTEASRHQIVLKLVTGSEAKGLTGIQKNELAAKVANLLGIDYGQLVTKRILQLMTGEEIAELAREGVDFQLHTHRHRTPEDELQFKKEIEDNRLRLQQILGLNATHFCYPSGVYKSSFFDWLKEEKVVSATTCDAGLASTKSDLLLLPRLVDTSARSGLEFEGWLSGVGSMLALRKAALQRYVPPQD